MKILLAGDHRGFKLKQAVLSWLQELDYQVVDLGNDRFDPSDDYPDFVSLAAREVAADPGVFGIVFCGSGAGANVVANKINGVRASLGWTKAQVEAARADDNLNVLVIAADFLTKEEVLVLIETFLQTKFKGEERHQRRLNKIVALEQT